MTLLHSLWSFSLSHPWTPALLAESLTSTQSHVSLVKQQMGFPAEPLQLSNCLEEFNAKQANTIPPPQGTHQARRGISSKCCRNGEHKWAEWIPVFSVLQSEKEEVVCETVLLSLTGYESSIITFGQWLEKRRNKIHSSFGQKEYKQGMF